MANVSGLLLTDPSDGSAWRYEIASTDEGRKFSTKTIPWEPSMPTTPWVKQLFPFDAGLARTKDLNPRGLSLQPQNPTDTFLPEFVLPGPATPSLTLTNATTQVLKWIYAYDSSGYAMFGICGRYLVRVDAITKAVTSQDLGAGNVASDLVQINGEIIICFSNNTPIRRRSAAGALTSGSKFAKSIVVVRNQIWAVGTNASINNDLSYILALGDANAANLLTTGNWTTNNPPYVVGDTSYQCYQLYDVAGTLGGCRPDGLYMPDPETKFLNVTPSIQRVPDASGFTGYGCFYALGEFWVPWQRGLLRVSPGNAVDEGPGTAYLPHVGLRVRGGLEWDRMMYILCTDERDSSTYVFKMIPDRWDIADGQFIFQPVAYVAANTTHFGRAIGMASPSTANPWLVYGGGSAATAASYILLGRGAGRDVDDPLYVTRSGVSYLTTGIFAPAMDASMVATLIGTQVYIADTLGATTPVEIYYDAALNQMPGDNASTLMATEAGGLIGEITESGQSIRYAEQNAQGRFFNMKAALTSTGTLNPALMSWTAFGYLNPLTTDEITVQVECQDGWSQFGQQDRSNHSGEEMVDKLRYWNSKGVTLAGQIEGYASTLRDDNRPLYFMVREVGAEYAVAKSGAGPDTDSIVNVVDVKLVRVDMSGEYGL